MKTTVQFESGADGSASWTGFFRQALELKRDVDTRRRRAWEVVFQALAAQSKAMGDTHEPCLLAG